MIHNRRQQAEAAMVKALEALSPVRLSPGERQLKLKVEQIEASPGAGPDTAHIIWRLIGSEWPGAQPMEGGAAPLYVYEILVSATSATTDHVRNLADMVVDALLSIEMDGWVTFGETVRIDEGGWSAAVEFSMLVD